MILDIKIEYSQIQEFCEFLNRYDLEFDIYEKRTVIDGKSLLGLYSLNLNNELKMHIIGEKKEINKFLREFNE